MLPFHDLADADGGGGDSKILDCGTGVEVPKEATEAEGAGGFVRATAGCDDAVPGRLLALWL